MQSNSEKDVSVNHEHVPELRSRRGNYGIFSDPTSRPLSKTQLKVREDSRADIRAGSGVLGEVNVFSKEGEQSRHQRLWSCLLNLQANVHTVIENPSSGAYTILYPCVGGG